MRVETESKYYCIEPERLINWCEIKGLKKINYLVENDEYFTDLDSLFIRNRTCLRLRDTNHTDLEITFKGKSLELLGQYSKIENNIKAHYSEYDKYVALFSSLGFYSYVNVNKERIIYNYPHSQYECNIMIDKLFGIGGFVEFEVITDNKIYEKDQLIKELDRFVQLFKEFNLIEATEPYRDLVAKNIYKSNILEKNNNLYVDLDHVVIALEKEFYKKYKDQMEIELGYKLKWGMFRRIQDDKIQPLINDYFTNKMFDTNELLAIFKLLKELKYHVHFITKANKMFYDGLLRKIHIDFHSTYELIDHTISKDVLKKGVVLSGDLKNIIQIILIIINMESK